MIDITGNMFTLRKFIDLDALCITTNEIIKRDGKAVMGAGVAKQAKNIFYNIDKILADLIKKNGHITQVIKFEPDSYYLVSFPTKYHWKDRSDISLIEKSTKQLLDLTNEYEWKKVILPRPGCSNGGLNYISQVKPLLSKYLDDRFFIITK